MNATPPEARSEYSRAPAPSGTAGRAPRGGSASATAPPAALVAGGLLGALLLLAAELTTLYDIHTAASAGALQSVATGSHHAYAMIPIALLAAVLSVGARRQGSRPALVAVGALGIIALLIALLGDLPDAHASGLISISARFANASATPRIGLYLETLGAALLILSSGLGLLLGGTAWRAPRSSEARDRAGSDR